MTPAAIRAACQTRQPHEVARRLGLPLAAVYEALAWNAPLPAPTRPPPDLPPDPPPAARAPRPRRPGPASPAAQAALIARFRAGAPRWTVSRVAARLGEAPATVHAWLAGRRRLPAGAAERLDRLLPK